jgi:hypothetical protein
MPSVPTWTTQLKVRAERAEVDQLVIWIAVAGTTVSGPNEAGIYDVTVEAPVEQADDINDAISHWSAEHPGAIIPPDDWLPSS